MKPIDLVAIFVRFFSVIVVLIDLSLVLQMAETIRRVSLFPDEPLTRSVFLADLAIVLTILVIAALFWLFPFQIARFFLPKGIDRELQIGMSAEQLEICLLAILGASILIGAFPQVVRISIRIAAVDIPSEEPAERWADFVFRLTQVGIGLGLLLRSDGIRQFVQSLRTKRTS